MAQDAKVIWSNLDFRCENGGAISLIFYPIGLRFKRELLGHRTMQFLKFIFDGCVRILKRDFWNVTNSFIQEFLVSFAPT